MSNDDKEKKSAWWDKKYGKEAICPITYTRLRPGKYKNGEPRVIRLPKTESGGCGHAFWSKALHNWMLKSTTCPVCRTPIPEKLIPERLRAPKPPDYTTVPVWFPGENVQQVIIPLWDVENQFLAPEQFYAEDW